MSKFLDGFESKICARKYYSLAFGQIEEDRSYRVEDISDLLDHAKKLEAILKKNEFVFDGEWCPECGFSKDHGHDDNCKLARLLND